MGALAAEPASAEVPAELPARQQTPSSRPWVVVPIVIEGDSADIDAMPFGDELVDSLVDVSARALDPSEAATQFEEQHSSDPEAPGAVERWATAVANAQRIMATRRSGRFREAVAALESLKAETDRAVAALGREEAGIRSYLQACILEATAQRGRGRRAEARDALVQCRRMTSLIEPESHSISIEIRALLAEVDAEIASAPRATLTVESDRPGCAVRVAGVVLGQTPLVVRDLPEHRVPIQVECDDRPGRVHVVDLRGETLLHVDTVREAAIRTHQSGAKRLFLTYATRESAQRDAIRDSQMIERALGAVVVLVVPYDAGRVRLVRVSDDLGPAIYFATKDRTDQLMWQCAIHMVTENQPTESARSESGPTPGREPAGDIFAPPSPIEAIDEPPVESRAPRHRLSARARRHVAIGSGLVGASVVPMSAAIFVRRHEGECAPAAPDTQCRPYRFARIAKIELSGGVALAGAGLALALWAPLRELRRPMVSPPVVAPTTGGLMLELGGMF